MGILAAVRRMLATKGPGPCSVPFCGRALRAVEGDALGFCDVHGYDFGPSDPSKGWPHLCPACLFPFAPPKDGLLSCGYCHFSAAWPPREKKADGKRRFNIFR